MGIQIISYRCNVKNRMGHKISSSIVRDAMLDPESEKLPLQALNDGLIGIKKGEVREISLRAQEAYGLYDPKLVMTRFLDESDVQSPLKMDEQVIVMKDGIKMPMRVIQFSSETVTLDGNHPLAGQDLIFEIHVIDTREATAVEISESRIGLPYLH
jgi:FKBP-type peptidyl-prolyl cis-trans isomerase SlyD